MTYPSSGSTWKRSLLASGSSVEVSETQPRPVGAKDAKEAEDAKDANDAKDAKDAKDANDAKDMGPHRCKLDGVEIQIRE